MKYIDELVKAAKGMSGFMKKAADGHMKKAAIHKANADTHEEMANCHKDMAEAYKSEKADQAGLMKGMHTGHGTLHKSAMKLAAGEKKQEECEMAMHEVCKAAGEGIDESAKETEKAVASGDPEAINKAVTTLTEKMDKALTMGEVELKIKEALDKYNSEQLEPMVAKTIGSRMVPRGAVNEPVSTEGVAVGDTGL